MAAAPRLGPPPLSLALAWKFLTQSSADACWVGSLRHGLDFQASLWVLGCVLTAHAQAVQAGH